MFSPSDLLPPNLRRAAGLYYSRSLDDPSQMLFEAFEFESRGDVGHRQATWLCTLACHRVLYGWRIGNSDGDLPKRAVRAAESWVLSDTESDWAVLSIPAPLMRNGLPINDCDASRLGPIADAAAATAKFANSGSLPDAVEALDSVYIAVDHGVHYRGALIFEHWIAEIALPAALDFTKLTDDQIRK